MLLLFNSSIFDIFREVFFAGKGAVYFIVYTAHDRSLWFYFYLPLLYRAVAQHPLFVNEILTSQSSQSGMFRRSFCFILMLTTLFFSPLAATARSHLVNLLNNRNK